MYLRRSDPAAQIGEVSCAALVRMGMRRSRGKHQLESHRGPLATAPTNKLLHRITKELAKGKARRAVPPWSIPREIWLMMLRPRDPDILETNMPTVTEANLNNRLLQTTSSQELLAIMRGIREKQAANRNTE